MCREIYVGPQNQKYRLIFWRISPKQPLQYYQLKTVSYEAKAFSFFAIKLLERLGQENRSAYPRAAHCMLKALYTDDCLTGADKLVTAKEVNK